MFVFENVNYLILFSFSFQATIVISDLISSLFLPGDPIGYLAFRTYTYSCQGQIVMYLVIYKIAHYMKVTISYSIEIILFYN